jgi:hypothetical protein
MRRIGLAGAACVLAVARAGAGESSAATPRSWISLDQTAIWQDAPSQTTAITILSAGRDLSRSLTLFGRLGLVGDGFDRELRAWGVANPTLGATVRVRRAGRVRVSFVLASTLPVGSGGGDAPARPSALRAMLNGTDWGGPMFGPNHLDVSEGIRLSATAARWTLRARSTLHPAVRVRGAATDQLGPRVIFASSGLTASYAPASRVSVFADLAETRFLNEPVFLRGSDPGARADHYGALGVSMDLDLGGVRRLSPTLSVARAVDAPKNRRHFRLVEIEIQIAF